MRLADVIPNLANVHHVHPKFAPMLTSIIKVGIPEYCVIIQNIDVMHQCLIDVYCCVTNYMLGTKRFVKTDV